MNTTRTDRTTVKRLGERGRYDRAVIDPIIDEALICHVGTVEDGLPMVIPTLHARIDDHLILHGSPASRMLRSAKQSEICVTITLVDGFVLARSALHHSMNYRSVVILGRPEVVPKHEKAAALDALVERLVPGRLAPSAGHDRRRGQGHLGAPAPHNRGLGKGPHRPPGGRRR